MAKIALIGFAVVVVTALVVIASRPATFHIERSITIAAPPDAAFARVNDFHEWVAWSPYETKDPQMRRTYDGPRAGTGAVYAWAGDGNVGAGRMTILRSDAPSRVGIQLEFFEPFAATHAATFTFAPVPAGTQATWAMDGTHTFLAKAISLVMDMDAMIGGDFAQGLGALKTLAERSAATGGLARS